jgi:hypothetical protein
MKNLPDSKTPKPTRHCPCPAKGDALGFKLTVDDDLRDRIKNCGCDVMR